jgi:hypothetical protein
MMYFRGALVTVSLVVLAACASSTPGGNTVDADDSTDADETGGDASDTTDAPDAIDGAEVDSSSIDGASIDGASVDGASVDGAVVIDAAVDASTCPTQPCDLHQQCGCTSPLVCDIDFTDLVGTQCRAVNAAGTETSTCGSFSECAGGYVCVGNPGTCERYCDMDSDCGQPRGQCVIQLVNGTMPIVGATTCSSNCNPVNSAAGACPAGMKCGFFTVNNALTGNTDRDIVDCTTPGAGTHGAACTTDAQCASDHLCSTYNAVTACRRVCNITTGGNECAQQAGTTCLGFNPALVVGGATYGICRP